MGAYGTVLKPGITCATGTQIPAGTTLYIDGYGEVVVEDTTADWIQEKYNGEIIDIYVNDHDMAYQIINSIGSYSYVWR